MHIRGVALKCKCRYLILWMRMLVSTIFSLKFGVITASLDSACNTKKHLARRAGCFFCVSSLKFNTFIW